MTRNPVPAVPFFVIVNIPCIDVPFTTARDEPVPFRNINLS